MAIEDTRLEAAADLLFGARAGRVPVAPLRHHLAGAEIADAYAIQRRNIDRHLALGDRIAGRKIGLTSLAVQRQLGVDRPDFGILLASMDFGGDGARVPLERLIAPRIEAEFAFRLKADITTPGRAAVEAALGEIAAAAEIVDSAIANWDIGIIDTVADNASSGGFVIGPWVGFGPSAPGGYAGGAQMLAARMRLHRDGAVISEGVGAASLGDPVAAVAWLAGTAIEVGMPLRAGEIILSGSLGPLVPLTPGQYVVEIEGFAPLHLSA